MNQFSNEGEGPTVKALEDDSDLARVSEFCSVLHTPPTCHSHKRQVLIHPALASASHTFVLSCCAPFLMESGRDKALTICIDSWSKVVSLDYLKLAHLDSAGHISSMLSPSSFDGMPICLLAVPCSSCPISHQEHWSSSPTVNHV